MSIRKDYVELEDDLSPSISDILTVSAEAGLFESIRGSPDEG